MHKQAREYVEAVKATFPSYFRHCKVLEIGSKNVNGTIRTLFDECEYVGLDLSEGKGVDVVCHAADYQTEDRYNTIICMEALEHDRRWKETLKNAVSLLAPYGLLILTAAGPERKEHGTRNHTPEDSPDTLDYYGNLCQIGIKDAIMQGEDWVCTDLRYSEDKQDIYFHGIHR